MSCYCNILSSPDGVFTLEEFISSFITEYIQSQDSKTLVMAAHIAALNITPKKSDLAAELKMIILPSISLLSL